MEEACMFTVQSGFSCFSVDSPTKAREVCILCTLCHTGGDQRNNARLKLLAPKTRSCHVETE